MQAMKVDGPYKITTSILGMSYLAAAQQHAYYDTTSMTA